jgi:hypothetical protein
MLARSLRAAVRAASENDVIVRTRGVSTMYVLDAQTRASRARMRRVWRVARARAFDASFATRRRARTPTNGDNGVVGARRAYDRATDLDDCFATSLSMRTQD